MSDPGMLVVYSGPSGVGKGTVLAPYLESHPDTVLSISMTTRSPRPGEQEGVSYYFVTKEQFEQEIETEGLLEYANYSGNYYGTPRQKVEEELARGHDVILEIEVQGAMKIRETFPQAVFVFILPPSYDTLRERLVGRGTESAEVVERRLAAAKIELDYAQKYDYVIVNKDVQTTCKQLDTVIRASKFRVKNCLNLINKVSEIHEYA